MDDEITNKMLLEHIQAMRYSLEIDINGLRSDIKIIKSDILNIKIDINNLSDRVDEGFKEAALHRKALQEDLDATIKMQAQHQQQLKTLAA